MLSCAWEKSTVPLSADPPPSLTLLVCVCFKGAGDVIIMALSEHRWHDSTPFTFYLKRVIMVFNSTITAPQKALCQSTRCALFAPGRVK